MVQKSILLYGLVLASALLLCQNVVCARELNDEANVSEMKTIIPGQQTGISNENIIGSGRSFGFSRGFRRGGFGRGIGSGVGGGGYGRGIGGFGGGGYGRGIGGFGGGGYGRGIGGRFRNGYGPGGFGGGGLGPYGSSGFYGRGI